MTQEVVGLIGFIVVALLAGLIIIYVARMK